MTSPDVLKLKILAAILEAIDPDDPKDAEQAVRMIRALLDGEKP
jgi:hypothetical protein